MAVKNKVDLKAEAQASIRTGNSDTLASQLLALMINVIDSFADVGSADPSVLNVRWSIVKNTSANLHNLAGDEDVPTDGKFYGKSAGAKGWFAITTAIISDFATAVGTLITEAVKTFEAWQIFEKEVSVTASTSSATVAFASGTKATVNITASTAVALTFTGLSGKSGFATIRITGNAQNVTFAAGTRQNNGSNAYPVNLTWTRASTDPQVLVVNYYSDGSILIN